jgi:DNA primase
VAYSGRLLPEAQRKADEEGRGVGKYINSRDTPLYHKGDVVFNLHRGRKAARQARRLLVMEGPTDVMAADQAGVGECVAVLGTALTPEHARQLGAAVGDQGSLILLFDGDAAGQTNSIKAIRTCLQAGVPSRASTLPGGQDPAELLGAGGREAFDKALARPVADIDQLLHALAPRPHELDQRGLMRVVDGALEPLRGVKDQELLRLYAETVATYVGLDRERIWRRLRQGATGEPAVRLPDETFEEPLEQPVPALGGEQETVLHILVRYPDLRGLALDEYGCEPCFFPPPWQELMAALLEDIDADAERLTLLPVVQRHPAVHAAFYRWRQRPLPQAVGDESGLRRVLAEAVSSLRQRQVTLRLRRAEHRLREAQRSGDSAAAKVCFQEVLDLQRLRRQVEGGEASGDHETGACAPPGPAL